MKYLSIRQLILAAVAITLVLAPGGRGALVLQNGSFEDGTDTGFDVAGVNEYTMPNWSTKEPLDGDGTNNNRNTVLDGTLENISATVGTRWVRLAANATTSGADYGAIYQNLGQFDNVGDVGDITAAALFDSAASGYKMSMELRQDSSTGTLLDTFTADQGTHTTLTINYTALAGDLGKDIFLVIRAGEVGSEDKQRTGTDNVQLTFTPATIPVPAALPGGLLLAGAMLMRRRR